MDRHELLKTEYAEAGQCCRAQESYVRTTLNIYVVLASGAMALIASVQMQPVVRVAVCLAVSGVGLCMLLLVIRHRNLYAAFAERARAIEAELGLKLYTQAKESHGGSGEATAKALSAFIVGVIATLFLAAAFFVAFKSP